MTENVDTELALAIGLERVESDALDLYTGYEEENNRWFLLIRYTGDINDLVTKFNGEIYYLLASYAIINLSENDIFEFAADPRIIYVEKPNNIYNQAEFSKTKICAAESFYENSGLNGTGVLMAVVDSGIDFTHPEFLDETGKSRIYEYWDQTANNGQNAYMLGNIYTNKELNDAIELENELKKTGEYIPSGLSNDESGHGTAVAAICAGSTIGVAPETELLVVKTGSRTLGKNASTLGLILGIDYCINTAISLEKPVVINLSFGNNYGSHTGKALMENYINDVSKLARCFIVTGTGNEGLTGKHYQGMLGNTSFQSVEILVGDFVNSFNIQIWKSLQDDFEVNLIAPNGERILRLDREGALNSDDYKDSNISGIYGLPNPYNESQEIFISLSGNGNYVTSGIWRLIIYPKRIVNGKYNIYLPVSSSLSGDVRFLLPSEFGSLTIPSTNEVVLSVAAYNGRNDSTAPFSGRGYTASMDIKPDIAAPGVDIYTAASGGTYTYVSGTSFAAPFAAGAAALLMEWGLIKENDIFMYGQRLKASLIAGARQIPEFDEYPNPYIGWGTLCIRDSIPL